MTKRAICVGINDYRAGSDCRWEHRQHGLTTRILIGD